MKAMILMYLYNCAVVTVNSRFLLASSPAISDAHQHFIIIIEGALNALREGSASPEKKTILDSFIFQVFIFIKCVFLPLCSLQSWEKVLAKVGPSVFKVSFFLFIYVCVTEKVFL